MIPASLVVVPEHTLTDGYVLSQEDLRFGCDSTHVVVNIEKLYFRHCRYFGWFYEEKLGTGLR